MKRPRHPAPAGTAAGGILVAGRGPFAEALAAALSGDTSPGKSGRAALLEPAATELPSRLQTLQPEILVLVGSPRSAPDLETARSALLACRNASLQGLVAISSAAVHPASHRHSGMVEEEDAPRPSENRVALAWRAFEALVGEFAEDLPIAVLRPSVLPVPGAADLLSRCLLSRCALRLPGHDPALQILTMEDLALAVQAAAGKSGSFHLAPAGAIPLRQALRRLATPSVPVPLWIQRLARRLTSGPAAADELEYLRYGWSVSGEEGARRLGIDSPASSVAAVDRLARSLDRRPRRQDRVVAEDPFGFDPDYVRSYGRRLFPFLEKVYWRIEIRGLENVPRQGRAVLTGIHRGLMPWDGVMALHAVGRATGRFPRFLIHPTLVKSPFLFNFMRKLGGVPANRRNAHRLLEREDLMGIFPEGIRGAFCRYRDAYRLQKFGRDEYVRMALRSQAPIVPFVTVGSAEIFPILAKIRWPAWQRATEWPCLPITPTFPLLPIPLPSKWHTTFLEPMDLGDYPPEAADDAATVREISGQVQARMLAEMTELRRRRPGIFHGSAFASADSEETTR